MNLNRPVVLQILIVIGLVSISLAVSMTIPRSTRDKADAWLQDLTPTAVAEIGSFASVQATNLERARLTDQLTLAKARSKHHLSVAVYFFSNYYMSILQAFIMGAVAAVALFFITKVGYTQASPNTVTVFVTATVLATFYGAFPSVFRQPDNVAENKALYLRYVALQNEMFSYAATGLDAAGKKASAAEYIRYIDIELNKANNIAVGFDATKLPAVKFDIK